MIQKEYLTREEFQSSMKSFLKEIESMLTQPIQDRKDWLRTTEAADYLSISQSQLHSLKADGIISCTKLGGTNYYDRQELDEILEKNKNQY